MTHNTRRLTSVASVAVTVAVSAVTLLESAQSKGRPAGYTSGPYLFRTFCASCHGEGGRGDGPVATVLRAAPPDLTTLTTRHDGRFPRAHVLAVIDGRVPIEGHGRGEMPVWGDVLRITEGQDERTIAARLAALVAHIESLQRD